MSIILQYLLPLLTTIFVEFIIFWVFIRKKPLNLFVYSVLINSSTQPLATYAYQNILNNLLLIEVFVFITEIFLIKWLFETSYKKALAVSFVANLVTAAMSLLF